MDPTSNGRRNHIAIGELHEETFAAIRTVAVFYETEQRYSAAEVWFKQLWRNCILTDRATSVLALGALNDLDRIYKESGRYITGSPESMEQCLHGLLVGGAVIRIESETAIRHGILDCDKLVLRMLIECGMDVHASFERCKTPLYLAAAKGLSSHVRLLIQQGAEPNALIEGDNSALIAAAHAGHIDVVHLLLDAGSDVNYCGKIGTALKFAARSGHNEVVQLLLDRSSDPNMQDSDGMTALCLAAYTGCEKVVQLLLERHADPDLQENLGITALHNSLIRGHQTVVQLLLWHKASTKQGDIHGRSALYFALVGSASEVVDLLWSLAVHPVPANRHGRNLLHYAAAHGRVHETRRLLDNGYDRCSTDKDGWTALHWAAENGSVQILDLLRDAGADENAVSFHGWTPRTIAVYHQNDSFLTALPAHDSDHSKRQAKVDDTSMDIIGHRHEDLYCFGCFVVRQLSDGAFLRRTLTRMKDSIWNPLQ